MIELNPNEFTSVLNLLAGIKQKVLPFAICQGINPGRIFVDQRQNSQTALIWSPVGYYFLAGKPDQAGDLPGISRVLTEVFIPASQASGETGFILISSHESWRVTLLNPSLKKRGICMLIKHKNLIIRNAEACDAEQLCIWWNDGKIMAHAGFPKGVGCTPEEIRESLAGDADETHRRHIIELDGKPIGEMNYRNKGGAAELGIKICDFSEQEKGYGTALLSVFIDALFRYYGYEKMILDTNLKNERAQHVYEKKLGFRRLGIEKDAWHDQLGEQQSKVNFEMSKADWLAFRKVPLEYIKYG